MAGDLIELARFSTSAEASMARARLDAEGIRAELDGEAMASWFGHFGSAVCAVRLLVNDRDVDRASEILRSDTSIDETSDVDFGDESVDDISTRDDLDLPDELVRAWRA